MTIVYNSMVLIVTILATTITILYDFTAKGVVSTINIDVCCTFAILRCNKY